MIRNWHSNLDSVRSSELFLLNNHLQIKPYLKQFDEAPMLISFLWKNCLWVTLTFFNVICHNTLDLDLFQVITFLSILVTQKVYFLAPIMRRISVVTTICWCQGTLIYLSSFFLCFCYITIIIIVVCFTCNTLSGMSSLVPTHTHFPVVLGLPNWFLACSFCYWHLGKAMPRIESMTCIFHADENSFDWLLDDARGNEVVGCNKLTRI